MEFTVRDREISIYGEARADAPVIYLNTVHGEGKAVWDQCQRIRRPEFSLVAVSGLQWDHDMSPWPIPPIAKGDTPCTGGADGFRPRLS